MSDDNLPYLMSKSVHIWAEMSVCELTADQYAYHSPLLIVTKPMIERYSNKFKRAIRIITKQHQAARVINKSPQLHKNYQKAIHYLF